MHEASLVSYLLDEVLNQLEKLDNEFNNNQIESIEVIIGSMANVEISAFEFAFEVLAPQKINPDAKLIIITKKAVVECYSCKNKYETDEWIAQCPVCGSFGGKVLNGDSIILKRIILKR